MYKGYRTVKEESKYSLKKCFSVMLRRHIDLGIPGASTGIIFLRLYRISISMVLSGRLMVEAWLPQGIAS